MKIHHFSLTALAAASLCAQTGPEIREVTVGENGRLNIDVDGPSGEYIVESTTDLESPSWANICRFNSDGTTSQVNDPIDESAGQKFYRIVSIPTPTGTDLTNAYATALDAGIVPTDLGTLVSTTFGAGETTLPSLASLPEANRNNRVYAAAIGALARLAQEIYDNSTAIPEPTTQEIVDALITDMAFGTLDGLGLNDNPIEIGATGEFLPNFTEQDLLDEIAMVKLDLTSLYNLDFTGNGDGTVSPSVPATWCNFYWDSADWQ